MKKIAQHYRYDRHFQDIKFSVKINKAFHLKDLVKPDKYLEIRADEITGNSNKYHLGYVKSTQSIESLWMAEGALPKNPADDTVDQAVARVEARNTLTTIVNIGHSN